MGKYCCLTYDLLWPPCVADADIIPQRLRDESYSVLFTYFTASAANKLHYGLTDLKFELRPYFSPFPQIDIIRAVVIVWRVRGKLSGLFCAILCATIVHSAMHTHMNRLTVLWIGFCLTGPISLC